MADRNLRNKGDENRVEGLGDDIKGRVKDAVGGLTGDESMQAEGKIDRAKGKLKDTVGRIQQDMSDDDADRDI